MARVIDPVCEMVIDSETAAARTQYKGEDYFFCAEDCKRQFEASPERYVPTSTDREVPVEKHDQTFTKAGGMPAPKFGSAGSGGAEFEPGPERHDR